MTQPAFTGAVTSGTNADHDSWLEANRHWLLVSIDLVRSQLALATFDCTESDETCREELRRQLSQRLALADNRVHEARLRLHGPSALDMVAEVFGLTRFERDVVLLAASPVLTRRSEPNGRSESARASFGLAFRLLESPHWTALAPNAPLRYHHIVELEHPDDPVHGELRLDERMLYFLLGVPAMDSRLVDVMTPVTSPVTSELPESYRDLAQRVAAAWASSERPVIQLCGPDPDGKRAIASLACAQLGLRLFACQAAELNWDVNQRALYARLIERELILTGASLLILVDDDHPDEARLARALTLRLRAPVIVATRDSMLGLPRAVRLDLPPLCAADQRALWRVELGPRLRIDPAQLDLAVAHFALGPSGIRAAAGMLSTRPDDPGDAGARLWNACRVFGRSRIPAVARRIESAAETADLILPDEQHQLIEQIVVQLAHRTQVHEGWGFAERSGRGLGLSALFYGDSGTGKTLAAEVIANRVRLDLWRVDLSRVLDKYIGETEKHLRQVFDAAEEGGAVLLFDEADSLFGKRAEVKDSADRFANAEIAYLLQRMEEYRGLAILTTNLHKALDSAFMRRIRFVVQFPFPRAEQRERIWCRAFPPQAPVAGLDMAKLAQLNLPGGNIRNIALNAAFRAAASGSPIVMLHVLRAAQDECAKLQRKLTELEVRSWIE